MQNSTYFIITLDIETSHAVAVTVLRQALLDAQKKLLAEQRFNYVLERAANEGAETTWRFHVREIDIVEPPPQLPD